MKNYYVLKWPCNKDEINIKIKLVFQTFTIEIDKGLLCITSKESLHYQNIKNRVAKKLV